MTICKPPPPPTPPPSPNYASTPIPLHISALVHGYQGVLTFVSKSHIQEFTILSIHHTIFVCDILFCLVCILVHYLLLHNLTIFCCDKFCLFCFCFCDFICFVDKPLGGHWHYKAVLNFHFVSVYLILILLSFLLWFDPCYLGLSNSRVLNREKCKWDSPHGPSLLALFETDWSLMEFMLHIYIYILSIDYWDSLPHWLTGSFLYK